MMDNPINTKTDDKKQELTATVKQAEYIFEEEKIFAPLPPSFLLSETLQAGNRIIIDTDMESDDTRAIIELFV